MKKCMNCASYWRDETKKGKLGECEMQGREMSAGFSGKPEGKRVIVSPGRKSRIKFSLYYALKARKGGSGALLAE